MNLLWAIRDDILHGRWNGLLSRGVNDDIVLPSDTVYYKSQQG